MSCFLHLLSREHIGGIMLISHGQKRDLGTI